MQIGDSVWCLSDPRGERGYFSTGIVNRFVERTVGDARGRRINVSTDWAPGSSGAAILDEAGNVIGHVATIRALFSKAPTHTADDFDGGVPEDGSRLSNYLDKRQSDSFATWTARPVARMMPSATR